VCTTFHSLYLRSWQQVGNAAVAWPRSLVGWGPDDLCLCARTGRYVGERRLSDVALQLRSLTCGPTGSCNKLWLFG
jgi:hypothetical protein